MSLAQAPVFVNYNYVQQISFANSGKKKTKQSSLLRLFFICTNIFISVT